MFGLGIRLNLLSLGNAAPLCFDTLTPNMDCWDSVILILSGTIILVAVTGFLVLFGPDLASLVIKSTLLKKWIILFRKSILSDSVNVSIEESGDDPPNPKGVLATATRPATVDVVVNRTTMTLLAIVLTILFVIHINRRDFTRLAVDVFFTRNQASTAEDNLRYPVKETGEVGDIWGHPDDVAD